MGNIKNLFKNKFSIGLKVIERRGFFKGIIISIIYFFYNLHKMRIIAKVRNNSSQNIKKIKLFNGMPFVISLYDSGLSFDILLSKIREPYATKRIMRIFEQQASNGVFLDIGANIGYYTVVLNQYFKKIVCVEPNIRAISLLRKNIDYNNLKKKTQILEGAIHFDTSQLLYMIEKDDMNLSEVSLISGDYAIKAINLVDLLRRNKPDFIKMDIEGFEFPLFLKSREELLCSVDVLPSYIFLEIHHEKEAYTENVKLFELFDKLGYKINSAIWEEKGPYYLRNHSGAWNILNKILKSFFVKNPILYENISINQYCLNQENVLRGKLGAIEYIFEKK